MSLTAATLRALDSETPSIGDVGGEELLYKERIELLSDPSLPDIVGVLCRSWDDLKQPDAAATFLVSASQVEGLFPFADVLDVLLSSTKALPHVADRLVEVLRENSQDNSTRAEIAIEGWTRLALGKWCRSLEVRAALVSRATSGATSPYFIRALGAAFAEWRDSDIEEAILQLVHNEEVEGDLAMELGTYRLAQAAESPTIERAVSALEESSRWFARADHTEERRDAPAFKLAARNLLAFAQGEPVSEDDINSLRDSVHEYLVHYRNEAPHWRQPRAQALVEWVSLVESMRRVSALDDPAWFEPAALINSAAALFSAHQSLTLVVRWENTLRSEVTSASPELKGIAAIVQPRIKRGFAAQAHSISFLDQWMHERELRVATGEEVPDGDLEFIYAISDIIKDGGEPNPKAGSGPVETIAAARQYLRSTSIASSGSERASVISAGPLFVPSRPLQIEEERIVRRILIDCKAIVGDLQPEVEPELTSMLSVMVMYEAYLINKIGSGERKVPFLGHSKAPFPMEHELADGLHDRFLAAGLPSQVERSAVGGGRVDIALQFARFKIMVEIKRELQQRDDAQLLAKYGDQAIQYASTDVPLAFLAVLDFSRHLIRGDLDSAFWTAPHKHTSSRVYALTGLRVQGNTASPSKSSR